MHIVGKQPAPSVFNLIPRDRKLNASDAFRADPSHVAPLVDLLIGTVAGDLPEAKAKVLCAVQEPFQKALLTGKTTHAAWRSKPSFYAVSTEDRTINPDLERLMAKRMGAKTIEVKASHLSLISQPDEITQPILEAASQRP
jgi:pimeloyl-ACP methyl ester carboxylesterase